MNTIRSKLFDYSIYDDENSYDKGAAQFAIGFIRR